MNEISIRAAGIEDAEFMCQLLIRSITQLCAEDHHHNAEILNTWLAGKTKENMVAWIAKRQIHTVVAYTQNQLAGVASIENSGFIHLCYVAPEWIGKGIGHQLFKHLEAWSVAQNISELSLTSTATAKQFYQNHGMVFTGTRTNCFGTVGYPMKKML
ncbi:MAG: GNAT family N-acetyltransferase [Gammaproteobacteria bacterium]|nr:GNAT family N-acetyltransferase [Gammaproteobacteria bacterium]